jgi:hypothetical protein
MANEYLVDPDVGFINEVSRLGGADVKNAISAPPVRWPAPSLRTPNRFPERR